MNQYTTSKCNRGHIEIILVPREDTIEGYKAKREPRDCHACREAQRRPFISSRKMLERKQFKALMNELVSLKKAEATLNRALKQFEPDLNYIGFGRYETLALRAIEAAMDDGTDKTYQGFISLWIYDLNMGKDARNPVDFGQGVKMPLKTLDELYNVILYNNKRVKNNAKED